MMRSLGGTLIAACVLALAGPQSGFAQSGEAPRAESYTFAFENAEISQVVQEVLGQAGVPYALDPGVTGKISFRIEQRLTRDQLLAALEAVLAANNVAMVRQGQQLLITPQTKAKSTAEIHRDITAIHGSGYELVAVPLSYAQPSEVAHALDAIAAADTVVYSNDKLGLLLLGGSGSQLRAALDTLKIFDQSAFEASKIRWFELNQAQATTVAAEVERIVQGAGLVGVNVVPLKRLNGVIVFGRSTESLDEISKWVRRLDTPGKDLASTLFVYRPQFSSAESLARTLSSLMGGSVAGASSPSAPPTAPMNPRDVPTSAPPLPPPVIGSPSGLAGDDELRIGVDRESNTLLFFATPPKWVQVQRILAEVDRPQRQILIEASIMEVTLGKQFQFGVDWSVFSGKLHATSINNGAGEVAPAFPGLSITYINKDIEAALNALGSRTNIEVVSRPKIIALDNRTARLQVGDQVPVVSQSSQSTASSNAALINTIDYRSTGVILDVTPRITGDNRLILDVSQEVSSVAETSTSRIDSPTIQQRRFQSTLVIDDGATVALGGLISTTHTANSSGVPFLHDIPYVGGLFGSQTHDNSRSELIVLLSARIITDRPGAERAMTDLAADLNELQSRGLLPKHP
jgi:general secretion pathway protein D